MAVEGGLGGELIVHGYAIGADVSAIGRISGGPAPMEIPGITLSGMRRIGGKRDGGMEVAHWWNSASGQIHDALKALPTTDRIVSALHGQIIGNPVASTNAKQVDYKWKRGRDGSLAGETEVQSTSTGVEWGRQLTAGVRTDTGATNGTSIDTAASLSFGAQAYLHAGSFSGTDVTVKIQDSADNSSFADVTGLTFTQITGSTPLAQRLATAGGATIRRYLRAVTVTTGGFSSLAFFVAVIKNETTVTF